MLRQDHASCRWNIGIIKKDNVKYFPSEALVSVHCWLWQKGLLLMSDCSGRSPGVLSVTASCCLYGGHLGWVPCCLLVKWLLAQSSHINCSIVSFLPGCNQSVIWSSCLKSNLTVTLCWHLQLMSVRSPYSHLYRSVSGQCRYSVMTLGSTVNGWNSVSWRDDYRTFEPWRRVDLTSSRSLLIHGNIPYEEAIFFSPLNITPKNQTLKRNCYNYFFIRYTVIDFFLFVRYILFFLWISHINVS